MSRHGASLLVKRSKAKTTAHKSGRRKLHLIGQWKCKAFDARYVGSAQAFFEDAAGLEFGVRCKPTHGGAQPTGSSQTGGVAHRTVKRGQAPRPTIGHLAALNSVDTSLPPVLRCHACWHVLCAALTTVASARRASTCGRMASSAKSHTRRRQRPIRRSAAGYFVCCLLLWWHAPAGWQEAGSS